MDSLFDVSRQRTAPQTESVGRGMREADAAIREARAGRMAVPAMLESVLNAQVLIPVSEPPTMNGTTPQSWKPATVTKPPTGARFVVAFTSEASMTAFSRANPAYSYGLLVEARWMLGAIPSDHGIAFNLGGENALEWSCDGISAFRADYSR